MPVYITTDIPRIKVRVNNAWQNTLAPLAEQMLTDCNQ